MTKALARYRICDFTGQLAGAGATRHLAAFGAQVIRIEDPTNDGRWDILRGQPPYVDERRGINLGGSFNNHNAGKPRDHAQPPHRARPGAADAARAGPPT